MVHTVLIAAIAPTSDILSLVTKNVRIRKWKIKRERERKEYKKKIMCVCKECTKSIIFILDPQEYSRQWKFKTNTIHMSCDFYFSVLLLSYYLLLTFKSIYLLLCLYFIMFILSLSLSLSCIAFYLSCFVFSCFLFCAIVCCMLYDSVYIRIFNSSSFF